MSSVSNVTKITYPDSYYVERVYDELNRLTDIKLNGAITSAASFDYDDLSRRTSLTFGNGVQVDYGHEWNNDLASIEKAFTGSDLDFSYSFNDVHQLVGQTISDSQHMWHPAAAGAVEYKSNNLNQYVYASGSCGRLYKGYNDNGCLVDDGVWKFGYDTENQLVSADDGSTSVSYVYNPMHRQIQKDVDGTKTRYVYSGWQRIADYDGTSDTLQNRYVYGMNLDEPLITASSAGVLTYLHADRLGSIVALSDNTGAVTNRYAYSPFGESDSMTGTTFGFTGQRYDQETGLYYYKNRYYSPVLGRFLQPDPILAPNLYTYVDNDPLNNTDPYGKNALAEVVVAAIYLLLALATILEMIRRIKEHEKKYGPTCPGSVIPDIKIPTLSGPWSSGIPGLNQLHNQISDDGNEDDDPFDTDPGDIGETGVIVDTPWGKFDQHAIDRANQPDRPDLQEQRDAFDLGTEVGEAGTPKGQPQRYRYRENATGVELID